MERFSKKQIENWSDSQRIVIYENVDQFSDFIEESLNNKQFSKKIYFGKISENYASIIRKETGLDLTGYNCSLSADEIRKISKDHGNEQRENNRGQRAVQNRDLLNIPEVMRAPDEIELSEKKYDGKPGIYFKKYIDGKMTVVAVVSDKHLDLRVQTAYVGIKKGNLSTPTGEQAPANTPEASRGTISNSSISQNPQNVNSLEEKADLDEEKIPTNSREYARMKAEKEKAAAPKRVPTATYKPYSVSYMQDMLSDAVKLITSEALSENAREGDPYFVNIKTRGKAIEDVAARLSDSFNLAQEKGASEEELRLISEAAADHLIANTYADDADFAARLTEEQDRASRALSVLSHGIRRMTLGNSEVGDIQHHYGKKAARSVLSRWRATKNAKGTVLPSEIANELAELSVPLSVENDSWAEADILIALNELYLSSKETFEQTVRSQIGTAEEYTALRDKIAAHVMEAYREGEADVRVEKAKAAAKVIVDVTRAKELSRRKRDTGALASKEWEALVKSISSIATTYNISIPAVRDFAMKYEGFISRHAGALDDLLTAEDGADGNEELFKKYVEAKNDSTNQVLDAIAPNIARGIYAIAEGDASTPLTLDELEALHAGIRNLLALDNRYNRVFKEGRWQNTDTYAKAAIKESRAYYGDKSSKGKQDRGTLAQTFFDSTEDPEHVAARIGGYDRHGILASAVHEIKLASIEAQYKEKQYMAAIEDYLSTHKDFRKRYRNERIDFKYVRESPLTHERAEGSVTLTLGEFLSLYMTSKRKHAFISLAMSDIKFDAMPGIRKDEQTLRGLHPDLSGLTEVQIEALTRGMGNGMISQINRVFNEIATAEDKEFIGLIEKFFSEVSKREKRDADLTLFGYTNVIEGYYYPIARDKSAFDVNLIGNDRIIDSIVGVNSFSFNKATIERANKTMRIRDAYAVTQNHAHQLAIYSTMTVPLQNLNRIYNCKVGGADGSLKDYINGHVSKRFGVYLRDYLLDVQGAQRVRAEDRIWNEALSYLKSNYAKSVLALNAKSIMTQFSTVFATSGQVSYASWAKGLAMGAAAIESEKTEAPLSVTADMTSAERYEILKDRRLSLTARTDAKKLDSVLEKLHVNNNDIEFSKYGDKKRIFKKIGDEFKVYHKYKNSDVKLSFEFSKGNMGESVSKQKKNYIDLAKMLTCLDSVVENAIGIEVHNRNSDGYKPDATLKNVYVLSSAFVDGDNIIPVKLEVKEFSDKENTLHVAVALESIKKDGIVKQEVAENGVARQYSPPSSISIAEFFRKINPVDESFLKYVPKEFFGKKADSASVRKERELSKRFAEMDKYSHAAAVRNDANEQYLATGALGKLGRTTDKLMIGQLLTDRVTCLSMFYMCQYEVQRTKGLAVGTKENKIEAGKLLDDLILALQDTSGAATKTSIARSRSELVASLAMFRSSELKQWSRLAYGAGEMKAHGIKGRRGAYAKEAGAFLSSKIYAVALALIWAALRAKWPKDEEGKDKNILEVGASELFVDLVGFVPIVGSIAELFFTNYGVETPGESVINDGVSAVKTVNSLIGDIFAGNFENPGKLIDKSVSALCGLGQVFGIPARNVKNLVDIAINGVNLAVPSSEKYKLQDALYSKNYTSDLKEAVENGDMELAGTIIDMMMHDRAGSSAGGEAASEIAELYASGETGLFPSKIGDKITVKINDESVELELTAEEQAAFRKEYGKSSTAVKKLIGSKAYERLTTSERATAIRDMYSLYMNRTKSKLHGADMTTAVAITSLISEQKFISAYAHIKAIKSDGSVKNKKVQVERYLRTLGLSRAEQMIILYAAGYRSDANKQAVLRAIRSSSMTAEEKATVARALGFEVKGTRIIQ